MYKVIDELDFSKSPDGLIPVVTQDCDSLEVLMVAFVNKEALAAALECVQKDIVALAQSEGLTAHANAVQVRFEQAK